MNEFNGNSIELLVKWNNDHAYRLLAVPEYLKNRMTGDVMILICEFRRPNMKLWKTISKEEYFEEKKHAK